MPDFKGSLLALLDPENIGFIVAWAAVGALFAALIFAISVVSMPMILHRQTDAITAGLTSLRLVLTQPGVMLWWALLITLLVGLALLPAFAGCWSSARWSAMPLACLPRGGGRLSLRRSVRRQAVGPQGSSTLQPVVLRASRSRCACATSASA